MIPTDVYTWTSQEQGRELQKLAIDKICLEVGAWVGFTTICMARTARIVYSVDQHVGDVRTGRSLTLPAYLENLTRYHVINKVAICVGKSEDILVRLPEHYFEFAFIDAAHDYDSVKSDTQLTLPLLKSDALIAFHDYEPVENDPTQEVMRAVDEFIAAGAIKPINNVGSLLVCQYQL